MQKWPYADFAHLNVEFFRFKPQKGDLAEKQEHLNVQVVFVPDSEKAMFFDHYTKEYKGHRRELDEYLEKLGADGWKLTVAHNIVDRKTYSLRRYYFRRALG